MRWSCLALVLLARVAAADPAVLQFTPAGDAPDGWSPRKTKGGITIERRRVPDSKYDEYRAVVDVPIDPAAAAASIWDALRSGDMETLEHREILRAAPNELVLYDRIRTPIVSDRDYTILVRRVVVGARTDFRCETANELGPPPQRGFVRIPVIRAGWSTEPDGHGGTRLRYFAYGEPGGLVAAFLVRAGQADRSLADVERMVKRLQPR